jgi:orotidine-5'-phosphate decarboxylase
MQYFSEDFARIGKELRCYGIQAPGNRPERIKKLREVVGNDLVIFACGCGAEGGNIFDEAIKSGADFVIAGRTIYASENPLKKAQEIANKISDIKMRDTTSYRSKDVKKSNRM